MGQEVTVKKKRYWRKKASSATKGIEQTVNKAKDMIKK